MEVGGHLERLAEHDVDPRFLARLAAGSIPHVLPPLDEAAGEAPLASAELPGHAPDEQNPPLGVADDHRRTHTRIREEDEPARGAGRTRTTAALDPGERGAAARAPDPVVAEGRHG